MDIKIELSLNMNIHINKKNKSIDCCSAVMYCGIDNIIKENKKNHDILMIYRNKPEIITNLFNKKIFTWLEK